MPEYKEMIYLCFKVAAVAGGRDHLPLAMLKNAKQLFSQPPLTLKSVEGSFGQKDLR